MEYYFNPGWKKPRVIIEGVYYKPGELIDHTQFASRLGLKTGAYRQIIEEGLVPDPKPAHVVSADYYCCRKDMAGRWWRWLRNEATVDQIERIATIVRESDQRRWDYWEIREDEDVRSWLLDVLEDYTPHRWQRSIRG